MPESPDCTRLRVAFAGTPEFAAIALDGLVASQHDIVAVLTQPDRPAGRGRKLSPSAVKQRALAAGIPVLQPASLKSEDSQTALAAIRADVLVVVAYGLILPAAVLAMPALGCLNIHASLLPRWRGAAPIQRAILAGDSHTGVAIMQMDEGLDTGPVLLEKSLAIHPEENSAELHDRLALLGQAAIVEALDAHCRGELVPQRQTADGISYAEKLSKSEARLDFSQSAEQLHRRIRAYNPWPVAETMLLEQRVRIWRSALGELSASSMATLDELRNDTNLPAPGTVMAVSDDAIMVATGDGIIALTELQWPGKKRQPVGEFAQGKTLPGQCLGNVWPE